MTFRIAVTDIMRYMFDLDLESPRVSDPLRKHRLDPARLSRLMLEKKLDQLKLSKEVGVAQPTVSRWLSGKLEPEVHSIDAIALALGVETRLITRCLRAIVPPHVGSLALQDILTVGSPEEWHGVQRVGDGSLTGVAAIQKLREGEADVTTGFREVFGGDNHVKPVAILATMRSPVRVLAAPAKKEAFWRKKLTGPCTVAAADRTIAARYLATVIGDFLPGPISLVAPGAVTEAPDVAVLWEPFATLFKSRFGLVDLLANEDVERARPGEPGIDLARRFREAVFDYCLYAHEQADVASVLDLVLRLDSATHSWNEVPRDARGWRTVPIIKAIEEEQGAAWTSACDEACRRLLSDIHFEVQVLPSFLRRAAAIR